MARKIKESGAAPCGYTSTWLTWTWPVITAKSLGCRNGRSLSLVGCGTLSRPLGLPLLGNSTQPPPGLDSRPLLPKQLTVGTPFLDKVAQGSQLASGNALP